jgi:hypothetical protein
MGTSQKQGARFSPTLHTNVQILIKRDTHSVFDTSLMEETSG